MMQIQFTHEQHVVWEMWLQAQDGSWQSEHSWRLMWHVEIFVCRTWGTVGNNSWQVEFLENEPEEAHVTCLRCFGCAREQLACLGCCAGSRWQCAQLPQFTHQMYEEESWHCCHSWRVSGVALVLWDSWHCSHSVHVNCLLGRVGTVASVGVSCVACRRARVGTDTTLCMFPVSLSEEQWLHHELLCKGNTCEVQVELSMSWLSLVLREAGSEH